LYRVYYLICGNFATYFILLTQLNPYKKRVQWLDYFGTSFANAIIQKYKNTKIPRLSIMAE